MAHDVATEILSMAKSMQDLAFEQARWRMKVEAFSATSGAPTWPSDLSVVYFGFIDFATNGGGLVEIRLQGRQTVSLRMSKERNPVTQLLLNEMTSQFGGRAEVVRVSSLSINLIAGRRKGDKWSFRKGTSMVTQVNVGRGKLLDETLLDLKDAVDQLVELAFESVQNGC
jgi:hypothetical protein